MENKFFAIGVVRLRMMTDGKGVTTLVAGHDCTLRCAYCLNPQCFIRKQPVSSYTVQELLDEVKIDDLYFQATGGGITFGGGEPLLQAEFIHEFCGKCPDSWNICLETSLAVPLENLKLVIEDVDEYFIDIKDMNPSIYKDYTGQDNARVIENLRWLLTVVDPDKVMVRVPLIPEYNTRVDQDASKRILEEMGVIHFDLFTYNTEKSRRKRTGT